MKTSRILKFAGFGIIGIGFIALFIYFAMSLWNWLIPLLFHGPVITYLQTAGLFLLSRILLTGVAPHAGHRRHGFYGYNKDWKDKYYNKYRPGCSREEEPVTPEKV